jgi:hypothetical protein
MGAGSAVAFEEYLAKSPNGKHRDEAQENLTWLNAEATNTVQAFRDYQRQHPQGPHFGAAGKKIEDLHRAEDQNKENQRFQDANNSKDETVLLAYLKDYPSGPHHDQIYGRLDDVVWERANKNDKASLQAYVTRMPSGKHVSEASSAIDAITEAAKPAKPVKSVVDEKAAILGVVAQYNQAYNDRNVDALRKIWPTMDNKTLATTRDFFKLTNSVASSYRIDQGPQINGDEATVRVTLTLSYIMKMDGREQGPKSSSFSMTLKKREALGAGTVWQIQSVGK